MERRHHTISSGCGVTAASQRYSLFLFLFHIKKSKYNLWYFLKFLSSNIQLHLWYDAGILKDVFFFSFFSRFSSLFLLSFLSCLLPLFSSISAAVLIIEIVCWRHLQIRRLSVDWASLTLFRSKALKRKFHARSHSFKLESNSIINSHHRCIVC